ncbi:cilia- and flagella-associated protein 263 isoform X2 [Ranitomeya variabilis]|uniref:cilia- and flagella-associated protein 263 isoform X2 n=1 Tax=Ranitomeya variabilis TaxID=490064 RepID=UPI0040563A4E
MAETDAESVRTESGAGEEASVSELSAEQVRGLLRDTGLLLSTLKAETDMFEKFYKRLDPKDLIPSAQSDTAGSLLDFSQMRSRRRSKSRSTISDRLLSLTVDQKCDLVQRELEESREEAQRDADNTQRVFQCYKAAPGRHTASRCHSQPLRANRPKLDNRKATKEEAEIRSSEIKKAKYEFERDIARAAASNKKGERGSPEKILRYMEEKMLARDSLVDKLRLKNAALRIQKKKLQMQLKQKEEMGEVLNEVDFQQLKIENAQFLERIDERNQDLLQLKMTTGNTMQVLNSYKKLQHSSLESGRLTKEISSRTEILQRIELETSQVEQERAKAEILNKKLKKQLSDYSVPDVLQYVQEKMAQEELEKSVRAWERKVEIAELSLSAQRRSWEQVKAARLMPQYGQLSGEP